MNELYRENKDQGLVLIGIHTEGSSEKMAAFVDKARVEFPVCIDAGAIANYGADSYPDYYLIDRAGNVRVADLANGALDDAVALLLAEPAPLPLPGEAVRDKSPMQLFGREGDGDKYSWSLGTTVSDEPGAIGCYDGFNLSTQALSEAATLFSTTATNDASLTPIKVMIAGSIAKGTRDYIFQTEEDNTQVMVAWQEVLDGPIEISKFELPQGAMLDLMLPRYVTQLPFEEEAKISFPYLELRTAEDLVRPKVTLLCVGEVELPRGESTLTAWRYDLMEGETLLESYWVDAKERVLLQMKLGQQVHNLQNETQINRKEGGR